MVYYSSASSHAYYKNHHRLPVGVVCAVVGFDGNELRTLILRATPQDSQGGWCLLADYVRSMESAEDAVRRCLYCLGDIVTVSLEQVYTWSSFDQELESRAVSVGHLALVNLTFPPTDNMIDDKMKWVPLAEVPALPKDHEIMLNKAREKLKIKSMEEVPVSGLLPQKFTIKELSRLYELLSDDGQDARNIARKMLRLGVIKRLSEKERGVAKRGSYYHVSAKDHRFEGTSELNHRVSHKDARDGSVSSDFYSIQSSKP